MGSGASHGSLPIKLSSGCPQMSRPLTLELIKELEKTASLGKIEERTFKQDLESMKKLVETLPMLRHLPHRVKSRLVVEKTPRSSLPVNRRTRKRRCREMDSWSTCSREKKLGSLLPVPVISNEENPLPCWKLTSNEVHSSHDDLSTGVGWITRSMP